MAESTSSEKSAETVVLHRTSVDPFGGVQAAVKYRWRGSVDCPVGAGRAAAASPDESVAFNSNVWEPSARTERYSFGDAQAPRPAVEACTRT